MLRRSSVGSRLVTLRAADLDVAPRGVDQPVDHLHRGRLPAARGPDEDADLARRTVSVRSSTAGSARPGYRFVTWSKTISAAPPGIRAAYVSDCGVRRAEGAQGERAGSGEHDRPTRRQVAVVGEHEPHERADEADRDPEGERRAHAPGHAASSRTGSTINAAIRSTPTMRIESAR